MTHQCIALTLAGALVGAITLSGAHAQQNSAKDQLVGAWTLASTINTDNKGATIEPFGPHPLGSYIFDASGHYNQILTGSGGAKSQSVAAFGTYSVTNGGKTLVLHVVGSISPGLDGKDLQRQITSLSHDELKIDNSTPQNAPAGGSHAQSVWKRAQ